MKLDHHRSFKKTVTRWHETGLFCLVVSLFTAIVFFFAKVGFDFAQSHEEYNRYRWVPVVLMVLSGILLATNLVRLLAHLITRPPEEDE